MAKVFVVMKQRWSPIAITSAQPHEVFLSSVAAKVRAKELNKKANRNNYWVESAEMGNGEQNDPA